jgi:hypothetical protein
MANVMAMAVTVQGVEVRSVGGIGHCMRIEKTVGVTRAKRSSRWRWDRGTVDVKTRILLLPFCSVGDKDEKKILYLSSSEFYFEKFIIIIKRLRTFCSGTYIKRKEN